MISGQVMIIGKSIPDLQLCLATVVRPTPPSKHNHIRIVANWMEKLHDVESG